MKNGTGASITFSSSFFAEINDIQVSGEVPVLEAGHMGTTGAAPAIPGALKTWTVQVTGFHDHAAVPPLGNAPEAITIIAPSSAGGGTSTWTTTGFMSQYQATVPFEDRQTFTAQMRLTANPTV